jgi:hypothetical protein
MTESDLHMILASRAAVESEDNFYQKQCTEFQHTYIREKTYVIVFVVGVITFW